MKAFNRKLNRKENLLFLSPILPLIGVVAIQTLGKGDKLDRAERALAGRGAIDCGVAHSQAEDQNLISVDRKKVDDCVVKAFKSRRPFRARYDEINDARTAIEATDSWGKVLTPDGRFYFFYYRYPSERTLVRYEFSEAECLDPKVVSESNLASEWTSVGCGTCVKGLTDGANCLLHFWS